MFYRRLKPCQVGFSRQPPMFGVSAYFCGSLLRRSDASHMTEVTLAFIYLKHMPNDTSNIQFSVTQKSIYTQLMLGFRLPKPASNLGFLYPVMTLCWSANALERPSFSELTHHLSQNACHQSNCESVLEPLHDEDMYSEVDNTQSFPADPNVTVWVSFVSLFCELFDIIYFLVNSSEFPTLVHSSQGRG